LSWHEDISRFRRLSGNDVADVADDQSGGVFHRAGANSNAPADFTPRPTPGGGANTIDLTTTDFVQHALTVKHGSEVVFVVRLDSGPHILCLGKNGQCDPSLPGPQELRQDGGFSVDAGQTLILDFPSPGVYPITCSIYPSMNLVITVT
jgi:plastocyanin